ncbi:MAG: beta-ketoacyl synthase N-terminal-like domain-containing protein [Almyronema sp.]
MDTLSRRIGQLSLEKRALLESQLAQQGNFQESIAVIGMGCRFPQATDPEAFWHLLENGINAITEVPAGRWQNDAIYDPSPAVPGKLSTRWGGFLEQIDQFDPKFFGISAPEVERMDPQQRLLLEVAWEALEQAGQSPAQLSGSNVGTFIGISTSDYSRLLLSDPEHLDAFTATGGACSIVANRLAYVLDLRGPSLSVDTACSSSLVALHLACQSLRRGECEAALAGGVNLMLTPELTIALSQANMMAADGQCKTFDARADGYVRGEGCGIVVLKRLSQAVKDKDHIWALVRGSAVGQDGRSNGLTAPNGRAQQAVIHQALKDGSVAPEQISYVEAHGTGTSLGDPIEVEALKAVLMPQRSPEQVCWLGSIKTNIGHLEPAAGIAGFIKLVLALHHQKIPPHLHLQQLNPRISLAETTLSIPTQCQPWEVANQERRLAGISAFGFGGTNAHMVLEEAPLRVAAEAAIARPLHLLTLSAKSPTALRALAERYRDFVTEMPDEALAHVCFTANTGRSHFAHRLALVANSSQQVSDRLTDFLNHGATPAVAVAELAKSSRPRIGFLFTGQGSQYAQMGRDLYETQPTFRQILDRCAAILEPHLECSLLSVLYADSASDRLDQTAYTQPALVAIECALAHLWRSWGIQADVVMGHSVGEYAAACFAGALSLEDVMTLIAERGRLMQSLPANGMMAAVFASRELLLPLLADYPEQVAIAAVNGPENTVISGAREVVQTLLEKLEQQGIRACPLRVSHAFHSPLMAPIVPLFEQAAQQITPLKHTLPIVANLTGQLLKEDEPLDANYWCQHLLQPVQFSTGLETLQALGVDILLEIGPHPTLSKMGAAVLRDWPGVWLASLHRRQDNWSSLLASLQTLYTLGGAIDWSGFDQAYPRHRLPLPTYPFERETFPLLSASLPAGDRRQKDERINGVVNQLQNLTSEIDSILASIRSGHQMFQAIAAEPSPASSPPSPEPPPPTATVAEKLQTIVSEVGRIPPHQLSLTSRLEELGFDSLMLVEVRHQLISAYPALKDLPIKLFFSSITLQDLIQVVSQTLEPAANPVPTAAAQRDFSPALAKFRVWAAEFQPGQVLRIDKALVHKDNASNVLIARVEQLQTDFILAEVAQDIGHTFFYEHPKDHVTGLYIIEAARQFATVLSHLYYDVPMGMAFVLDEMQAQFFTFAETRQALFAIAEVSDKLTVDGQLVQMQVTISIVQNDTTAAVVKGYFRTFSAAHYQSLRGDALREMHAVH